MWPYLPEGAYSDCMVSRNQMALQNGWLAGKKNDGGKCWFEEDRLLVELAAA